MQTLPLDIKQEILLYLCDRDLIHVCAANKEFHFICQKTYFWERRGILNFPKDFMEVMNQYHFEEKQTYQLLFQLNYLRTFFPKQFAQKSLMEIYKIKTLDFAGSQLKSLPKEIGLLTNLRKLDLNHNQIQDLPKEIGSLVNLRTLDLSTNQIQVLPKEIGSLYNLQSFNLNYNKIQNLPKEIGSLQNLKELYLCENQIQYLPKEIGSLYDLQILNINYNKIQSLPKEIESLPLEKLILFSNPLKNTEKIG